MIFLDTSAIYAWADRHDLHHKKATTRLEAILVQGESLLTHNYVLLEAFTLLQVRLGLESALKLAEDCAAFEIEWVDKNLHNAALNNLRKAARRRVSLVDHISFLVMQRRNISVAFAFDPHFNAAGFRLFDV